MPLRWQGKKGRRGKIAGTLSSWTGTAAGTYTAPGTFLGRINALIYDWTGAIAGTFRSSSVINGVIAQQLEHWTGSLTGSTNRPPVWVTATSFSITQGTTTFQFQATDADIGQTVTYALQGGSSLPSGWSLSSSGLLTLPANAVVQQYPAFTVEANDGFVLVPRTFTVTVASAPVVSGTYSTTFPLTENPISESGAWTNTGNTYWTKVKTTGGNAFGTQTNTPVGGNIYDDSYALLSGFAADQEISAVIYKTTPSSNMEVELWLRGAESAGYPRGYECLLNHGGLYAPQINRWNGAPLVSGHTNYTELSVSNVPSQSLYTPANGDTMRAKIVGNQISVYLKKGTVETLIATATDNTFTTGQPGIGFYTNVGTDNTYGFQSVSATNVGQAASASQTDVQAAISAASVGSTVLIPAGTATWTNFTLNKAVSLVGAGIGQTNITLGTGNVFTKQTTGITRIRNITFLNSVAKGGSKACSITGAWTARPIVIEECFFDNRNTGGDFFRVEVAGGVIFAKCSFRGQNYDDSILQLKADDRSPAGGKAGASVSWKTNDTMGARDTTGERNIYIEDCYFYGGANQSVDADDAVRVVYRYNRADYSSFNSHGLDTSNIGIRHYEVYGNQFRNMAAGGWTGSSALTDISNQNWAVWIRGGFGYVFNNFIDDIANTYWGQGKPEGAYDIRAQEDGSGSSYGDYSDGRAWLSAGTGTYPRQHQLSVNWNSGVGTNSGYFIDITYIWGNNGPGVTAGGFKAMNNCIAWGNAASHFVSGRDFVNGASTSTYPTYTPTDALGRAYSIYTYPHPLRVSTGQAY